MIINSLSTTTIVTILYELDLFGLDYIIYVIVIVSFACVICMYKKLYIVVLVCPDIRISL